MTLKLFCKNILSWKCRSAYIIKVLQGIAAPIYNATEVGDFLRVPELSLSELSEHRNHNQLGTIVVSVLADILCDDSGTDANLKALDGLSFAL